MDAAFYIHINDLDDKPYEMFISSKSDIYKDWTAITTRLISATMRAGLFGPWVIEEMKQVTSAKDAAWVGSKYHNSIVAYVGHILEMHINDMTPQVETEIKLGTPINLAGHPVEKVESIYVEGVKGDICPKCNAPTLIHREGCNDCLNCGYSNCG
jgi:ribonucleoside-diphosphate reductase alpha chain